MAATSLSSALTFTPVATAFTATRLARASASALASSAPPQALACSTGTLSMPLSSLASMRASAMRYWRNARLPARSAISASSARSAERSTGASAGAGLPPSGVVPAEAASGSRVLRSSESNLPLALTKTGCADRLALPSSAKLLAFSEPASVHFAASGEACALPRTASASGLSCLSCSLASTTSAARLSADFAGCRPRSARSVPSSARPEPLLLSVASKPGRAMASKLPLGAPLLKLASIGSSPPSASLPFSGLPASLVPATSSCGQSRSSASASLPRWPLTRNSSASTRRACLAGS